MKQNSGLKNEDGSVLVVALIILVVLTLLGIAVTTTTEIETQIAGNEKVHKRTFYIAEATAMQCAQGLETVALSDASTFPSGVTTDNYAVSHWNDGHSVTITSPQDLDPEVTQKYVVVYEGPADTGESLDMAKAKIHEFSIYGRADWSNTNSMSMIKLGYRKAY